MNALVQCSHTGCANPVANDGAWHAAEAQVACARHRQLARNKRGACPNCGGTVATQPIINSLTGKPRTQGTVPLTQRQCTSCGYQPRASRGR